MRRIQVLLASVGLIGLAACGDLGANLENAKNEVADIGREARRTAEGIDWERVCDHFAEALRSAWRGKALAHDGRVSLRIQGGES